jgi:hypothetical protein
VKIILVATLLAGLAATEASAVILKFDVATENGARFAFLLPENPVPDAFFPIGAIGEGSFRILNVNARNALGETGLVGVAFGTAGNTIRLRLFDNTNPRSIILNFGIVFANENAPVLFTGSISDPTFKRGTFDYVKPQGSNFDAGTVRISAIPEPATWLSMIGGFGLAGGALRYRRRKNACTLVFQTAAITRYALADKLIVAAPGT